MLSEYFNLTLCDADKVAVKKIPMKKVEGQNSDLFGSIVCVLVTMTILSLLVADLRNTATTSAQNKAKIKRKLNKNYKSSSRRVRVAWN
jgi:uncharacterized membrane protein